MPFATATYYLNEDKSEATPAKPYKEPPPGQKFDESPDGAAYLLVRKGMEISAEDAEKYGVKTSDEAPEAESKAVEAAPENKAVSGPEVIGKGKKSAAKKGKR